MNFKILHRRATLSQNFYLTFTISHRVAGNLSLDGFTEYISKYWRSYFKMLSHAVSFLYTNKHFNNFMEMMDQTEIFDNPILI